MSGIFISQVGMQPAAVAVTVAALSNAQLISETILLYTERTKFYAENLQTWQTTTLPKIPVTLLPYHAGRDADAFASTLKELSNKNPSAKLYLGLAAGASFFWAQVSRLLIGQENFIPVFAATDAVYIIGDNQQWPIKDLGLSELLKLHGVWATWDEQNGSSIVKKFKVATSEGLDSGVFFDYVYEKRGYLHGLIENVRGLQSARAVLDILRNPPVLNKLRPKLLVTTPDQNVFKRLSFAGCPTLQISARRDQPPAELTSWHSGQPEAFGRTIPAHLKSGQKPSSRPLSGQGGGGAPLVVCLGNDPTSTISAIYTHKPRRVWVLYDKTNPAVVSLASNMARYSHKFPVDEVTFLAVGSGHLGLGITETILYFINEKSELCGNITPGTKPQSWCFGQIPELHLVSINTRDKTIQTLDDGTIYLRGLNPGPGLVVAQIIGGAGVVPRMSTIEVENKLPLLQNVAQCIKLYSENDGNFWFCNPRKKLTRNNGETTLVTEWKNDYIEVKTIRGKKTVTGNFLAPIESGKLRGDWLEEVVAGAFYAAGAKDLCVGMTWSWNAKKPENHCFRTEIDVVFSWGATHVAVSVKARLLKKDNDQVCREIRAMTRECLGRFALPVVVCYATYPKDETIILDLLKETGVLQIPASLLAQPDYLKNLLDEGFAQLSTYHL